MDQSLNTANPPSSSAAGITLTPTKQSSAFKVIDPGHHYALDSTTGEAEFELRFLKKVADDSTPSGLRTVYDGLTNEGVIAVLVSRLHYLQSIMPCSENEEAIGGLKMALNALERRTRSRQMRGVEGTSRA